MPRYPDQEFKSGASSIFLESGTMAIVWPHVWPVVTRQASFVLLSDDRPLPAVEQTVAEINRPSVIRPYVELHIRPTNRRSSNLHPQPQYSYEQPLPAHLAAAPASSSIMQRRAAAGAAADVFVGPGSEPSAMTAPGWQPLVRANKSTQAATVHWMWMGQENACGVDPLTMISGKRRR